MHVDWFLLFLQLAAVVAFCIWVDQRAQRAAAGFAHHQLAIDRMRSQLAAAEGNFEGLATQLAALRKELENSEVRSARYTREFFIERAVPMEQRIEALIQSQKDADRHRDELAERVHRMANLLTALQHLEHDVDALKGEYQALRSLSNIGKLGRRPT